MGDALDLNLFPSCYNCLSWSDDGELAIAAGDAVHLQLPQWKPKWVHPLFEKEKSTPWTSTKIRANVFTHREWEVNWPSNRDDFSIGAEQSLGTVVALAWSPQGLGKHRRCVLAVLTSNLLLSLYEADGQRRTWSRVAIVNDAIDAYFRVEEKKMKQKGDDSSSNLLRKGRVRAFAWCSPLKSEDGHDDHGDGSVRWGEQMLAVATDDNDVVLVQVKRDDVSSVDKSVYSSNVVSHLEFDQQAKKYPMTPGPSLWADALEQKARILHVACGPWRKMTASADGFGAMIAVVYGSRLQLVNIQADTVAGKNGERTVRAQMSHTPEKWLSGLDSSSVNFTGPLGWIPSDDNRILLVVGCFGGRATIWCDTSAYLNQPTPKNQPVFRQLSFQEEGSGFISMGATYYQHNEPMTGIVALDSPDTPKVYITTLGPVSETIALSVIGTPLEETVAKMRSPWIEHMERYRQRYNIQYELGDMTVARTWGLAAFRGWLAVAFSMHPGDVLEYTIRAEENTVVLFVPPDADTVFPTPPDTSEEHVAAARDDILRLILSSANELQKNDTRSARLVYAACMCAIITHQPQEQEQDQNQTPLLTLTHNALTHLSSTFDLPITEELSYCADIASVPITTTTTTTDTQDIRIETTVLIPAKPASTLEGPGGWIFESCQTCYRRKNEIVGLNWTEYEMAVCEYGHRWNRCRLTFLAIQEPYISLFCSVCDTNCLARNRGVGYTLNRGDVVMADSDETNIIKGENIENENGHEEEHAEEREERVELYERLYDRYDVCAYCGGKYQDE